MLRASLRFRRGLRRQEDGVSPVVGSVLILVIMIMSIAGILAWGVPAIQGLQEHAEFESIKTQFLQMDGDVRTLRDPQNTRIVTLSLNQGSLIFSKGDRWAVTATRDANYDAMILTNWQNGSPTQVNITGIGAGLVKEASVDLVTGGTFTTKYSCTAATPCPLDLPLTGINLASDVVRIQIKDGTVRAETWIFNVGRLSYRQSDASDQNRLHFEMGAVFSQQSSVYFLEQAASIKDPDYSLSPKDTNLFLRILQLSGTDAASSGRQRFPIVFNLVDNYGAARGRPSFDPATMVRVQVRGNLEVAFCNYFDMHDPWGVEGGGSCPAAESAFTGINVKYIKPVGERLVYDLSHAVVTTTVRTV